MKPLKQVMAALVISISLDVSVESVGSSFPRVILSGSISVEVPITPEVGATAVASPVGVLELDTHSSSKADPSEKSDTEIPERHVSPTPHDAMLTRWRSRVASRSSSPSTSTLEIPTAHIYLHHLLFEDIPIGRLYRTHPGRPCRALTARKSVRPLPSHRLALRYTSHHLDRFTSGSSSSHSSSRHSILGNSLPGHSSPETTIADSYTPLRFVHPPLARTPWCSEAYLRWRSTPLSTMYPPTTSESSAGDSSSESSVGPSRKRCRSPATTVTSSTHATRVLVPSRADLLLPHKRFKDSISPEDSVEEDIDIDVLEDIEADAMAVEVDVGVDVEDEVEDEVESSDRGTMEVRVDVVVRIDIPDAMLMPDALERLEQVEEEAIKELVNRRVEEALAAYEATRAANALEAESQSQNGSDSDNGNGGNGNGGDGNGGNGNELMKLMAKVYCPRTEIQKMESELWNLTMKNNDLVVYTQRFQELTMMYTKMVPDEEDRVEKFIGGLPDNI
ncbi:putative reverse transcriptase domain-containing protein [Tanacetum coccineum]